MKKKILDKLMRFVDDGSYSKDELEKIHYGFEVIYIFLEKSLIIFPITYFLGLSKYSLLFAVIYALLRMLGCGLHANKSWICTLISLITFIVIPYLCKTSHISINLKLIIGLLSIIGLFIFAPADTKKRPIVNKNKRIGLKIIVTAIGIIYLLIAIKTTNNVISNSMLYALLLENIIISPVTYKLFKLPYNNYKLYMEGGRI